MKFKVLQDNLRKILWSASKQASLPDSGWPSRLDSNKPISPISSIASAVSASKAWTRFLHVQHLSVLDLLDPAEVNKRASILPPSGDEFENILLTDASLAATQPLIASMHVKEILKFKKAFLRKLKADTEGDRSAWQRFVLIKLDAKEALAMYPRLLPGATLLIDRHYNSLRPYRKGELNMYAVLKNDTCTVRYVEVAENHLILRPHNQSAPIEVMTMAEDKTAADYLVGRICHVGLEA